MADPIAEYPLLLEEAVMKVAAVTQVALDDPEVVTLRGIIRTVIVDVARAERDQAYARVLAAIEACRKGITI